jgi:GNAT superfamily N-acetyltransferase
MDIYFAGAPAGADDYERFVALFGELGTDDPIPGLDKWLKEMAPTTLFLRSGAQTLGYVYFNLMGEMAYVAHLSVAPFARRSGHGAKIMNEVASRCRAAGMKSWCLNVKPDNVAAIRLYESLGFRHAHSSRALRLSWNAVGGLPQSDAVQAGEVRPADDAAIESALRLPVGRIADLRKKPSRVLLWLSDGRRPVGFAAFDPGFPGAFPFCVEKKYARALLELMKRHARPELPFVQVVAEDNEPLAQALLDAGAHLKMAFEHYRGLLPLESPAR